MIRVICPSKHLREVTHESRGVRFREGVLTLRRGEFDRLLRVSIISRSELPEHQQSDQQSDKQFLIIRKCYTATVHVLVHYIRNC